MFPIYASPNRNPPPKELEAPFPSSLCPAYFLCKNTDQEEVFTHRSCRDTQL